ncbi:MAG: DUF4402 domain-containing protein [Pseudomonadota bacterium]
MRPRFYRPLTAIAAFFCAIGAAPAAAATQVAQVKANVVKPLTITWVQDLDLGTVVLGPGSWSGATVKIARTGVFTCATANVTCSGATVVAKYNVTGSNNMTVRISAPNVTLVNQSDATKTLTLVPDSPGTVTLTSSGAPGITFPIGGSITVNSTTQGGVYRGTFNVTVDY